MNWQPGTWLRWIFGPSRVPGAVVVCPNCGSGMSIGGGQPFGSCHSIAADGTVSPSVVCHGVPGTRSFVWPAGHRRPPARFTDG